MSCTLMQEVGIGLASEFLPMTTPILLTLGPAVEERGKPGHQSAERGTDERNHCRVDDAVRIPPSRR